MLYIIESGDSLVGKPAIDKYWEIEELMFWNYHFWEKFVGGKSK
jgi:hypothetical protein